MSEPFIGEIRIFSGNFAPRGWAFCDGQLLAINNNTALFSILGTTYGGDGRTTFALPDLRERVPIHPGRGPGLTSRYLGEAVGVSEVTLSQEHLPSHEHGELPVANGAGDTSLVQNGALAQTELAGLDTERFAATSDTRMADLAAQGGGQPHNNMQPYIVVNYIIALVGLYPSRS